MKAWPCVVLFLCVAGCSSASKPSRVGKYVYAMDLHFKGGIPFQQRWPHQWVNLQADGTYSARNDRLAASGNYSIQEEQIRFTSGTGAIFKGHFRGDVLELDGSCFGIRLSSDQSSPEDYFVKAKSQSP